MKEDVVHVWIHSVKLIPQYTEKKVFLNTPMRINLNPPYHNSRYQTTIIVYATVGQETLNKTHFPDKYFWVNTTVNVYFERTVASWIVVNW